MSRLEIDRDKCDLCELCAQSCPFDALEIVDDRVRAGDECTFCGRCVKECPSGAISIIEEKEPEQIDLRAWSGVWVFAEQAEGRVHPVAFELIGKGRALADRRGTYLAAVLLGESMESLDGAMASLRRYPVDKVFIAADAALARFRSETYAAVLAEFIGRHSPEIVLCGATSTGRAFLPRAAGLVRTGLTADCTGLEIDDKEGLLLQTRPAFGGNIMATIICPRRRPQMATVRPKVFTAPAPGAPRQVEVVAMAPSPQALDCPVELLEVCAEKTGTESIAEADIVVSGGRGVGGPEGFRVIRELAEALGGAVGASRAVVDAGWMPYPHQVGQTGKTVQPKLYVACGISGAVQHLVGMQSSSTIIAINKDPGAPIFRVADFGLVGDLHVIVPRLIEAIRKRKGARK